MNDESAILNEPDDKDDEDTLPDELVLAARGPTHIGSVQDLGAFAAIQRTLASIDFSATQAAQKAIGQAGGFSKIVEAQESIARNFARSIDFSGIAATHRVIASAEIGVQAATGQKKWADSLAMSIDFSALNDAVAASAALASWARTSKAFNESLRNQTEMFARIAESITFKLPTIDFPGQLAGLDRWIPTNLIGIMALDVAATIALDEGLPLSWVPRTEIVGLLIDADSPEVRVEIIALRRGDILDDCEMVLAPIDHEWAVQCRSAVAAMRAGFDGPAQSHASNIVDSIVLGLYGMKGREHVTTSAREEFDDLPLRLAAENLSLRPLFRAFIKWYPDMGIDPPDHFARHVTSHAVGHAGVFAPISALVAVMLATSLTVQYAPEGPFADSC